MAKSRIFTCRQCGIVFEGKHNKAVWCSADCKSKSGYGTKSKKRCQCKGCGKELFKRVQKANAYCSNACQQLIRKKKQKRFKVIYWCERSLRFKKQGACDKAWERKFKSLAILPKTMTANQLWSQRFKSMASMNRFRKNEVRRITKRGSAYRKRSGVTEDMKWKEKFHGMARNQERRMIRKGLQGRN